MIKWINSKIKDLEWYDISLTKLSVLFFVLFILTALPVTQIVLTYQSIWYLAGFVLCAAIVSRKFF